MIRLRLIAPLRGYVLLVASIFIALAVAEIWTSGSAAGAEPTAQSSKAQATASGLPVPRFASLRADDVNLRSGPGIRFPIDWVYRRSGMPVEIIDEFDTWRQIRDWQGTVGWVHKSMVQGRRTVRVIGEEGILRSGPEANEPAVARVTPGVIGVLRECRQGWCQLGLDTQEGWLEGTRLYGIYPHELEP